MEGGARIPRNNQFERITAEPGKGEFVWVKHKQPKPAPSHKDSLPKEGSAIEMTQQADTHHAESLFYMPWRRMHEVLHDARTSGPAPHVW